MQFARPNSTVSAGNWTAEGGPSTLFDCINEAVAEDTAYIQTSADSDATVGLSPVHDPGVHTGHVLTVRASSTGANPEQLQVTVLQGATAIAVFALGLTSSFANYSGTLTEAQAGAITTAGYGGGLRLLFDSTLTKGENAKVAQAFLSVPEVAGNRAALQLVGILPGDMLF
jgi:hypothetical protein